MQSQQGTVIALESGDRGQWAVVEVDMAGACPRCAAGKGCGAGLSLARNRRVEARVPPGARIHTGDAVELTMAPNNVLRAAGIVYGLPLAAAAAGAALAYLLDLGDPAAALAAVAGLGVGLFLAKRRLRGCLKDFTPEVVA
ncbi:MAG: SoxR reducing system RseC family protein [Woeseiaceae bacterium]|nr:SoxR reducing system RseC family protein [Woeseiaceae bacterium]